MDAIAKIFELLITKIKLHIIAIVGVALWMFPHLVSNSALKELNLDVFYAQNICWISGLGIISAFYIITVSVFVLVTIINERIITPMKKRRKKDALFRGLSNGEKQTLLLFFEQKTATIILPANDPDCYSLWSKKIIIDCGYVFTYAILDKETHRFQISPAAYEYLSKHPECLELTES